MLVSYKAETITVQISLQQLVTLWHNSSIWPAKVLVQQFVNMFQSTEYYYNEMNNALKNYESFLEAD